MKEYVVREYEQEDYDRAENMPLDRVIEKLPEIARGWLPDYTFDHDGSEDEFQRFENQMAMVRAEKFLLELKHLKEGERDLCDFLKLIERLDHNGSVSVKLLRKEVMAMIDDLKKARDAVKGGEQE